MVLDHDLLMCPCISICIDGSMITKVMVPGKDWEVTQSRGLCQHDWTDDYIKDASDRMHVLNPFCRIRICEDAISEAESSSPQTPNLLGPLSWTSWPPDNEIHISVLIKYSVLSILLLQQ